MGQPQVDRNHPDIVALREAQEREYSEWVATSQIWYGNALAYNEGDAIPAANVELHGYDKNGLAVRRAPAATVEDPPAVKAKGKPAAAPAADDRTDDVKEA